MRKWLAKAAAWLRWGYGKYDSLPDEDKRKIREAATKAGKDLLKKGR